MTIAINLDKRTARFTLALATIAACVLLGSLILQQLINGMLTDERVAVPHQYIAAGLRYAPNSARLLARLAETDMGEDQADLAKCETLARRAVNLSPWDYRYQLLAASIEEAKGDRTDAEQYLIGARALAPNYAEVHWRLANLMVRQGRVAAALAEFRSATASDRSLLPATYDLIWYASGRNVDALAAVTAADAPAQMALSQFLFKQGAIPEAAKVFRTIDADERRRMPESAGLIDGLIARGNIDLAHQLWAELSGQNQTAPAPLIWNGNFEMEKAGNLTQFDWAITPSSYLRPVIDTTTGHSGSHSLRLEFPGRDTVRLNGEFKQLVVIRPQARYRLDFYVRAKDFDSPEGPRMAIVQDRSNAEIAETAPIAQGSYEWRPVTVEFTAPADWGAVVLTIKRVPKFSYDDPTRGTLWFDDFSLIELSK
jgi:tetratricopeptide (TPR) repeat protein